jgi:hypothetical protein
MGHCSDEISNHWFIIDFAKVVDFIEKVAVSKFK